MLIYLKINFFFAKEDTYDFIRLKRTQVIIVNEEIQKIPNLKKLLKICKRLKCLKLLGIDKYLTRTKL